MPGEVIEQTSVMDSPTLNGTLPNGIPVKPVVLQNGGPIGGGQDGAPRDVADGEQPDRHEDTGGLATDEKRNVTPDLTVDRLDGLPIEVRQLTQHFRPFHKLVHRSVQQTWNSFSEVIDQLSDITVVPTATAPSASYAKAQINGAIPGDQSHENLEKKDRLLRFQQDQRALFIKFLVLHDWYKRSRGIDQAIEISMWMHEQRSHFAHAADFIGNMKRELALWQVPNPDLKTAAEILSRGRVSALSDLGYVPVKPLTPGAMLRTLRDIDILLCERLSLHNQIPLQLSNYRIHDGRVTFTVLNEFELDLSVADEDPSSQFYFIDFRYLFLPRSTFLSGKLHDDFATKINVVLNTDGLLGCYRFLHDLTLSYKLNSLRKQAVDMARKQWSDSLKIDLINRTLVVQYWLDRPMAKSWVEVGVMSGRRKRSRDQRRSSEPFLDLRWISEKKENDCIHVDFDASPLTFEGILRGVIYRHSSIILDRFYEKLLESKLYADGRYMLELSSSDAEPRDCSLRIQLTNSKHITLSVEPISGSLILLPASPLSGRTEFELNRLQDPAEEGPPRISMLRCLAAEQELTQQANVAGWEVLHTFRLSQRELRALFPSKILRYILIRQASWRQNVMVAATFSMDGDKWWLLYPSGQDRTDPSAMLVSQHFDCSNQQAENEWDSFAFFSQLKKYASGAIALHLAQQDLRQRRLYRQLPALPRLQKRFHLPLLKVRYLLANAKRVLRPLLLDGPCKNSQAGDDHALQDDSDDEHPSWIQPTVYLGFCGLNQATDDALLLAKGRTTASRMVLESFWSLTGSSLKVDTDAGEFSMRFQVPIGESVVLDLFRSLQNFDHLLSCLTIVNGFQSMSIQSLSLSQITIEYDREAELSTCIHFPSSASSVAIRLLPEDSNPHFRISHFIENLLGDLKRPFTANLGGVLTLLSTTHPLLTLFDELEKLETLSDPAGEDEMDSSSFRIRLHVIARSPTHYAVQYFVSYASSRSMIARFEMFRHLRRDSAVWILRAAHEETVSYSRSSFVDIALKQKLTDDVFNARGAQGWLGLDTGASCPIDRPGPLVRKIDEVVRSWAKVHLKEVLGESQKQEPALKRESGERNIELSHPASLSTETPQHERQWRQHQHQHQHPQPLPPLPPQRPQSGASRPAANGTVQNKAVHAQRPSPQGLQNAKDAIMLE